MSFFHFDLIAVIKATSYVGLFLIVFAESGLFFGFFLPGDSLLFTAGLLASQGFFNIWIMVALLAIAAIIGDSVGYWFGKKVGRKLFERPNSKLFKKEYLIRTEHFYEKHGPKALILARFVPAVRTFAPIFAGIGTMHYGTFLRYNMIGGILWSIGVTLAGYFLGSRVPHIDHYLLPIILAIIIISFIPVFVEIIRNKKK
jgi:membrane-associated protein